MSDGAATAEGVINVLVNVRLWAEIAQSSASAWTKNMARAAHAWFAYRQAR